MRVVITGGGTGGHIYPALAVAQALKLDPDVESILYIGNKASLESQLVPEAGFDFESIYFYGMPRKSPLRWVQWCFDLNQSVAQAKRLLKQVQPHVVFGTGGYVSAPVLMAAKALKIPYVIHEPDAHPGLVNRLMARWAQCVTGAFEASHALLPNPNFHCTGNPLRGSIGELSHADAIAQLNQQYGLSFHAEKPVLLVTGGSQGAQTLNNALLGALPQLLSQTSLQILHQTGQKPYEQVLNAMPETFKNHPHYLVQPYFSNMAPILGSANLALCRAGSLTLSEMYLSSVPTVLVPYPYAAANHQQKNAQASVQAGASLMILDKDCTPETVSKTLIDLLAHPEQLNTMAQAAQSLAHPQATQSIISHLKASAQ